MKIVVDARELEGRRTGVGRYLHELLCALAANRDAQAHEFVLCSSTAIDVEPYQRLRVRPIVQPGRSVAWEQVALPRVLRHERPDLLFAPGYTAPIWTSTPTVLVVHDVSFTSHPEWFSWREGARRRTLTRLAARHAAQVVTVSQFSKGEIEAHLGLVPARISVIPNGLTRMATPRSTDRPGFTVLFVGSIFNRRHVPALIDAIAVLAGRGLDVRLEIVGDNRTSPRIDLEAYAVAALVSDRVQVHSYLSEAELIDCYARARSFAFLSEYEGFGLTPLEALSAGVPIVVLDHPTTREVYDSAATFVNAPAPRPIADALERSLFDETERRRVLDQAGGVLARYSWDASAAQLLQVFGRVADSNGVPHAPR